MSVDNKGNVTVGAKTLSTPALPFTLRYPGSFQEATNATVAETHSVALVGIPGEDSYIAIYLNGKTRMSLDSLEAEARRALGTDVIGTSREVHAGIPMVAVATRVSGRPDLKATMYGFSLSGRTWLIQCRSNEANRASMEHWCRESLDSLKSR